MFENIDLISLEDNKNLYKIQADLIEEYRKNATSNVLIRIALLQTISPISNQIGAINVLESFIKKDFKLLIIGAYLSAECLDINNNKFLNILLRDYDHLDRAQKAMVMYLLTLHNYNRSNVTSEKNIQIILESIELEDKFVSNYYLYYIMNGNVDDKHKARANVINILSTDDIAKTHIEELIDPDFFIEEHITMRTLSQVAYEAMFS